MKTIFLFLLSTLLSIQSPVKKITIDPEKDKETKFIISELASEIRYVKLETRPDCMLDMITKVTLDNDLIFVLAHSNPFGHLFIFSSTGKFIRQIGKQGRGPGEYSSIIDFTLDKEGKQIYFLDTMGNLFIYNYSGTYVKRENILTKPSNIVYFDKKLLLLHCWPTYFQNNGFALTLKDLEHNAPDITLIDRKYIKFDKIIQDVLYYPNHSFSINNQNKVTLLEVKFDTLYEISSKGNVTPDYIINLKNKMPQNIFFSKEYNDAIKKYSTYSVMETKHYLLLKVLYESEFYIYFYNKDNGELLKQKTNKLTQNIYNDYDGGLSFSPQGSADINIIYSVQTTLKIKNKLTDDGNHIIKNPKANSYLKEEIKNANENDNPVLVLLTLKP